MYQEIWETDLREGNGVKACKPTDDLLSFQSVGHVVVDLRTNASPEHKLLSDLNIPTAKQESYKLCKRLFNNYTLDQTKKELSSFDPKGNDEQKEINDLLDFVVASKVFDKLRETIYQNKTDEQIKEDIFDLWFAQYNLGGGKDLSGFEHTVVGEQKGGEVKGYHFWYKYYLDDNAGIIDTDSIYYVGLRFDGPNKSFGPLTSQAFEFPEVATIAYEWKAFDYEAEAVRPLFKPIGGFFVGISVEALIAMGTYRFHTREQDTTIFGANYKMIMHLSADNKHIRSFFPEFRGKA